MITTRDTKIVSENKQTTLTDTKKEIKGHRKSI